MVNGEAPTKLFKVGDYYPNDTNPVGVVFKVNTSYPGGSANSGTVIALDAVAAPFSTIDDRSVETGHTDGYSNMRAFYQTDNDFSDYPAFEWVAEKNAAGYNYPAAAKGQWYLASDEELRHLMAGMCDLMMIGQHDPLRDGCINDWGRGFEMAIDDKGYTPDLTTFNKKITDKGGQPISGYCILSSSIDGLQVYSLTASNGRVAGSSKSFASSKVRAIMAF